MKRFFVYIIHSLLVTTCLGQVVSPDSVIVRYIDSLKLWEETTTANDGRFYSKIHYSDSSRTILHGSETFFYSNGNIRCEATYNQGIIHGNALSFYSDGHKKRISKYSDGRLLSDTCYSTRGGIIHCSEYAKNPAYIGGVPELYSLIIINSNQIKIPNAEKQPQGTIVVKLSIDKQGNVSNKEIIQSLHPILDNEVLRICEHIGRFEPAERDGVAVPGFYILPIRF